MFGIGPTELIVVLVIALLVLGPKRLPELARSLGRGLAEFRRATSDVTTELDNARIVLEEEARAAAREERRREGKRAKPAGAADVNAPGTEPTAKGEATTDDDAEPATSPTGSVPRKPSSTPHDESA